MRHSFGGSIFQNSGPFDSGVQIKWDSIGGHRSVRFTCAVVLLSSRPLGIFQSHIQSLFSALLHRHYLCSNPIPIAFHIMCSFVLLLSPLLSMSVFCRLFVLYVPSLPVCTMSLPWCKHAIYVNLLYLQGFTSYFLLCFQIFKFQFRPLIISTFGDDVIPMPHIVPVLRPLCHGTQTGTVFGPIAAMIPPIGISFNLSLERRTLFKA